jgi:hypothetical protein
MSSPSNTRLHWNYFLALEKDLEAVSRYIEFCPDNLNTYSIELAHLLLSAASEVDTLAKCICGILDPNAKPDNINQYRDIIKAAEESQTFDFGVKGKKDPILPDNLKHRLSALKVYVPRYNLESTPWRTWAEDKTPNWWHSYNMVKHERNLHFNKATLGNGLNALAALLALNYVHCRVEITKTIPQQRYQYRGNNVTRHMQPESTFLRFERGFYDNPIAELARDISSVSRDVDRLSGQQLPERD